MIFRQLFEPVSSTYTYVLGCETTRQALLIDPVMPAWKRDLTVLDAELQKYCAKIEEGPQGAPWKPSHP